MGHEVDSQPEKIELSGNLTIDRAGPLRDELSQAQARGRTVLVDVSAVEEIDLACLQVIYAARRAWHEDGRDFHLIGKLHPRIAARLLASGFAKSLASGAEELEALLVDF